MSVSFLFHQRPTKMATHKIGSKSFLTHCEKWDKKTGVKE